MEPPAKKSRQVEQGTADSAVSITTAPNTLEALPDEILMVIFAALSVRDLGAVSRVCRRLQRLANEEDLWRRHYVAAVRQQTKVKPRWTWKRHLRQATREILDLLRSSFEIFLLDLHFRSSF
eukprot:TRINITY_DN731_c1_g2_i1.p1 TRINITY_DN731_c1_g2~~TRINITY_DN731_c1_g2_i1.p1  ORF type:complete len:122 (+),score=12.28 TRINITY_DN731_c1_g2_i1:164-529(+)